MIPDELIECAARTVHEKHGRHIAPRYMDAPTWYRDELEAQTATALEAVAADIWDEGYEAAAAQGAIQEPDNPYRPWRTVWNVWKVHNGDDRNRHGDPRIGRDYRTEASAQEAADRMPNTRTEVRPRPLPTWVDSL